jgi:nitrate reductase NapAB chaperone NapD
MSTTHTPASDIAGSGVVLGAYARIDPGSRESVRDRLHDLKGVTLFDLDDPGKVGLVIEADDLEKAHQLLTHTVGRTPDVLGVWPVSLELDNASPDQAPAGPTSPTH